MTLLERVLESPSFPESSTLVQLLCDAGADLEHVGFHETNRKPHTALAFAVKGGNKDFVKFLLDRGAIINYGVLEATGGDPDMLSLLHLHKRLREEAASGGMEPAA